MFSRFFIGRPIFTWVIALFIMGYGLFALFQLPVEQYPKIAPPKISITANYPGASAETMENTVTQIIEQNLTGIDRVRYIQSESSSAGRATITLTFEPGTDPDVAQVQTQNKVSQSLSSLPSVVQELGVPIEKAGNSYALIVGFYSENGSMSRDDISDFLASNLEEPLSRVDGVGRIQTFGPEKAMRIWLNPQNMNNYNITTTDVLAAVEEQNIQLATGEIGGTPSVEGQQISATITAQSLFTTTEEFGDILLTVAPDGSQVRLADVARIELGAEGYNVIGRWNQNPASGIAIELAPEANALETIQAVKDRVKDFKNIIPDSLVTVYPIDISPFIQNSILSVVATIGLAIALVVMVIFVFLQTTRATLIPALAIPIVLLGTLGSLYALGYSVNVLTLFALVLAIGMLVDDAIVVTENVERKLEEDDSLSPKEAAAAAMKEISGALLGTTVVIWAVFLPMTLFAGSVGVIYRQFSVTISIAMALSLFVALTLSPALCGILLKSGRHRKDHGFFGWFNRGFRALRRIHNASMDRLLENRLVLPLLFLTLIAAAAVIFLRVPTSFLPDEDQGRMFTLLSTPPGTSLQETMKKVKEMENFYLKEADDAVEGLFAAGGFSFTGRAQNVGIAFIKLKDWSERGEGSSVFDLRGRAMRSLSTVRDARIFPIVPPPVTALGNASGFELQLIDQGGIGNDALAAAAQEFLGKANQSELLTQVRFNGLNDSPEYDLDVDSLKARSMGVPISAINRTLRTALGGTYVNDFLNQGRIKRVYAQADAPFRMQPEDIGKWYVRNDNGGMVQLAELASGEWLQAPPQLTRFNGSSSREIKGSTVAGVSSGLAFDEVLRIAGTLPKGIGVSWTGVSYEEKEANTNTTLLYLVSAFAVFLILAALYESWALPISIMLAVPLGIFGAILSTWIMGQSNDVYFQVGLLITIGLAAKNAILIVEFAKTNFDNGMRTYDAAYTAAEKRFRPILMTSLTFMLGVSPLAFASGPGSGAQNAISIGVLGGITTTTLFVLVFGPFFFIWVYRLLKHDQAEANRRRN